MPTATLTPTTDLYHVRTDGTESNGRNEVSSTTIVDSWTGLYASSYIDSGQIFYKRTYLEFDVSSLVGNFITGITLYGEYADILAIETPAPVAVYAGTGSLRNDNNQYSLYLDNGIPIGFGMVRQWGELTKPTDKSDPLTFSSTLDLGNYQVDPADGVIVIGIVSSNDFANESPYTYQQEIIYSSEYAGGGVVLPYIEVTYVAGGGGYANTIMGIPGANITTVSGVPVANIANIMGV